jgi:hypothetical protein
MPPIMPALATLAPCGMGHGPFVAWGNACQRMLTRGGPEACQALVIGIRRFDLFTILDRARCRYGAVNTHNLQARNRTENEDRHCNEDP